MSGLLLSPVDRAIIVDALELAESEVLASMALMHTRHSEAAVVSRFRDWLDRAIVLKARLRPPLDRS